MKNIFSMVDFCGNCEEFARKIAELEDDLNSVNEEADFMKTLWKQVQHESPDVGELVSVIFQKFTKQCEEKDNNILEILKEKDQEITKLRQEISWLESKLHQEKSERDVQQRDWNERQDDLNELISTLEEQLAVKNLEVLEDPGRKKQKQALVGELDEQKNSLEVQIVDMRNDLKNCVKELKVLKKKHERKEEENVSLQLTLKTKDEELLSQKLILSELKESLSDKKEDIALLKEKLLIAENDAASALVALERSEQRLRDTEKEYIESERKQKETDEKYQYSLEKLNKTVRNLEEKIESVIQENDLLLKENDNIKSGECEPCNKKNGQIETLQKRNKDYERYKELMLSVKDKCARYLDRQLAYQDIPDVIDIILADITGNSDDLQRSTKLIKQLQGNCQEKDMAFDKLKEMHDNRLERMGTLQEYLHEVLEEIKMLDRNRWTELYCDLNDLAENAPVPMRHEDGTSVWNNLQYYKNLTSKLKRRVHEVEEEYDKVRLERVMDANAFSDMKAAILADKQACEQKLRIANHQSICGCNLQVEILRDKIESLSDKNESLNSENVRLLSKLKASQKTVDSIRKKEIGRESRYTQTSKTERQSFGTLTDNIVGVKEKENNNFMNSLTLLEKLAKENTKDDGAKKPLKKLKTPSKSKTPMKSIQPRAVLKTTTTQTISKPPIKVLQKPPAAMKIRLASLSQQVAVLTKAKHKHEKQLLDEKSKTEVVEKQLGTALRQVASAQNLIVGLNEDIRVANEEIKQLKGDISDLQNSGLRQSELAQLTERSSEIKKLSHQNSLLNSQISNLSSTVRNLQQEVDDKKVHVKLLEDKIYKAEKSLRQNRSDMDTARRDATNYKSEVADLTERLDEAIKKSKRIQDVADNRKNYIETLKSQLNHAKANLEQANNRNEEIKGALDKQSKNLNEFRRKHVDNDKVMGDIQRLATKQLKDQEQKFHEIEDVFNNEISHLNKRNLQWEKCIRSVISTIVSRIKEEKAKKDATSSMSSVEYEKAKQFSSSILNLSEADFHDIMSSTKMGASSLDDTDVHVWKGQLAKILALDEFGPVLTKSIMQLFDEFARILTGGDTSIVTGNSLTHSEN